MESIDIPKLVLILIGYVVLSPIAGFLAAGSRRVQELIFGAIIFLQCIKASSLGLMFFSIEWYRGHTKGFEFTLVEPHCMLQIGVIVTNATIQYRYHSWNRRHGWI